MVYYVAACFEKQGGFSVVDPQTYLYYMEMAHQVSDPTADKWVAYTDKIEQTVVADFKRLWATNFLDDLSAETYDYVFSNGVVGKIILYNMEERQRVKIVDYVGSKKVEMSKIDDELKKKSIRIALDSFVDPGARQAGRRRRPRPLRGKGLRVRGGQAGDQAGQHRDQDRQPDLPHHRGPQGPHPRTSTSRATPRSRTPSSPGR